MYQVLVAIHNFKQLLKVDPVPVSTVAASLENQAQLFGATYHEITQGRIMIGFPIHRPGDSAFVVDSVLSIRQFLLDHRAELAGFTIILESGDGGLETEKLLRKLLVCATVDESLWLGPSAAATLNPFLVMEPGHGIWRVTSRNENSEPDLDIQSTLFDSFLPTDGFREFLDNAIAGLATSSSRVLAIASEPDDAAGDLVNSTINQILGRENENQFIWVIGHNDQDPVPVALTRTFFPQNGSAITEMLDNQELEQWGRVSRFLFQNAVSTLVGVPFSTVSPEYPDQLFRQAWRLYLIAMALRCSRAGQVLFIHVEHHHLLSGASRDLLAESLSWCSDLDGVRVVMILTGSQQDELPNTVHQSQIFRLDP